jgi:hypothetical protein
MAVDVKIVRRIHTLAIVEDGRWKMEDGRWTSLIDEKDARPRFLS